MHHVSECMLPRRQSTVHINRRESCNNGGACLRRLSRPTCFLFCFASLQPVHDCRLVLASALQGGAPLRRDPRELEPWHLSNTVWRCRRTGGAARSTQPLSSRPCTRSSPS